MRSPQIGNNDKHNGGSGGADTITNDVDIESHEVSSRAQIPSANLSRKSKTRGSPAKKLFDRLASTSTKSSRPPLSARMSTSSSPTAAAAATAAAARRPRSAPRAGASGQRSARGGGGGGSSVRKSNPAAKKGRRGGASSGAAGRKGSALSARRASAVDGSGGGGEEIVTARTSVSMGDLMRIRTSAEKGASFAAGEEAGLLQEGYDTSAAGAHSNGASSAAAAAAAAAERDGGGQREAADYENGTAMMSVADFLPRQAPPPAQSVGLAQW
jgi:hypothetical protein